MRTPPADLTEAALVAALEAGWSLHAARLRYRPVGFGSHHWEVTDPAGVLWFVTVDDVRDGPADYERLRAALATAADLPVSFVVGPVALGDGSPLRLVDGRFAVAVYPFVDGESFDWGEVTPEYRRAVLDLLAVLHTVPPSACRHALVDDYAIPRLDSPLDLTAGPYAPSAAELLVAHEPAVRAARDRYDDLVADARADPRAFVVTHGEPHPGNTMRTAEGWRLIDWDTVLLAPPERDLWSLGPPDAAYTAASGIVPRPALMDLYRLRWTLTDIAVSLARFRAPHADTADDQETWKVLRTCVSDLAESRD